VHGFPESWYSWRHQIPALADAGFHVVAPDLRGYGDSDAPPERESYSIMHLVGDMVGLVYALGEKRATIIGHDWGAGVAWNTALLRPDVFPAVVGLSVPYRQRGSEPPLRALRRSGLYTYYWLYYQDPGVAGLKQKLVLEGAGHYIQQERPAQVTKTLIDFLESVAQV